MLRVENGEVVEMRKPGAKTLERTRYPIENHWVVLQLPKLPVVQDAGTQIHRAVHRYGAEYKIQDTRS